jgi:acyl-CoA thioesterase
MTDLEKAHHIVYEKMFANEQFIKWLGIEIVEVGIGFAKIKMMVRHDMTNGHQTAHGGITYSLADSCFAYCSNSLGKKAVSIETSISHTRPVFVGDELMATSSLENESKSLAIFNITVTNQNQKVVALFKGTVFRSEEWEV